MKSKEALIELCALTSTCVRDCSSLHRQYRELIYNEPDISRPIDDKLNLYYRLNSIGLKMISQRVIHIDTGIYIYMYKECLLVVIGSNNYDDILVNKIIKYIHNYKIITSNICPTVIWCSVHVYLSNFTTIVYKCIKEHNNVYHDIFMIGNIEKHNFNGCDIREVILIALAEEKPKKKDYIVLQGYGFNNNNSNIFDYLFTVLNRVQNLDLV